MPLGIDATIRYHDEQLVAAASAVSELRRATTPYNTRTAPRPAADADRQPRPRVDQGGGQPREDQVPLLRPQARQVRRARVLDDRRAVRARRRALPGLARRSVMTCLGVCGWPVAHSRSPRDAQRRRCAAAGPATTGTTCALPLPPQLFAETVRALPAAGFRGVNVTIPHKEAALALADEATRDRAGDRRRQHADVRGRRDPRRQHRRARLARARCATCSTCRADARSCSAPAAPPAPRSWALRAGRRGRGARSGTGRRRAPQALADELGARARRRSRTPPTSSSTARRSGLDDPEDHVQGASAQGR